jgi:hypothetical protein
MTTHLRLTGLVVHSRYYTEPRTHRAVHDLLLAMHGGGGDVLARRTFDDTPAAHIVAERLARSFRHLQRATVHATGWAFDEKRRQLVLTGVDHTEPEHQPAPAHQLAHEAA